MSKNSLKTQYTLMEALGSLFHSECNGSRHTKCSFLNPRMRSPNGHVDNYVHVHTHSLKSGVMTVY